MVEKVPHAAACHCGSVRFRVRLLDGFNTIRRCTCSYCRMRGAISAMARLEDIEILHGEEQPTLCRFHTGTARHYFCKTCGIHTHHVRRSDPSQAGVNVACIEGVSPFDFLKVVVMDGTHHPRDLGPQPTVAGSLRYEPNT